MTNSMNVERMGLVMPDIEGVVWRDARETIVSAAEIITPLAPQLPDATKLEMIQACLLVQDTDTLTGEALGLDTLPDAWQTMSSELDSFQRAQVIRTLILCADNGQLRTIGQVRKLPKPELKKIEGIGPYRARLLRAFGRASMLNGKLESVWLE
jgi:hypothetical protein